MPNFLNDIGVSVVISGGMGSGEVDIFNEKGIEVIVGAIENADVVEMDYIQGKLKSTGNI